MVINQIIVIVMIMELIIVLIQKGGYYQEHIQLQLKIKQVVYFQFQLKSLHK